MKTVDPRFPIGRQELRGPLTEPQRRAAIDRIAALPHALHEAVRGLDEGGLDTPYRRGGWTVRQVVHHIADSHVNAYIRHKLTISQQEPVLQGYDERAWAEMADTRGPIGTSLLLVQAIHERWAQCLRSLPAKTFANRAHHTESGIVTLDDLVATYEWHGRHHVAQITAARRAGGF